MYSNLYRNGYYAIPQRVATTVCPRTGTEHKKGKAHVKFVDRHPDEQETVNWDDQFVDANVALVTGYNGVMALDVDCTLTSVATSLRTVIRERWPSIPLRVCNDPKFVVLFKAHGEALLNVKNGHSQVFKDNNGTVQQVELAGHNTLITLYGEHRKTGNPYKWGNGQRNPLEIDADALPELTLEDIEFVFNIFNANIPKKTDWQQVGKQNFTKHYTPQDVPDSDDPMVSVRPASAFSTAEIDNWISNLDGSQEEVWVKVGHALHSQYNGAIDGLTKWDDWSKKYDGYEPGACAAKWEYFDAGGGRTVKGLVAEVKRDAKETETSVVEDLLANLIWIEEGSKIADLREAHIESVLALMDKRNSMSNINVKKLTAKGEVTYVSALKLWQKHASRKTVRGIQFKPIRERIMKLTDDGRKAEYWNSYVPPQHKYIEPDQRNPALLKAFTDHVEFIFDGPGDAQWMMGWMADMVQRPCERPTIHPLHINQNKRTGRGTMTKIISTLLGRANIGETKLDRIGDAGAKNGYMKETLAVFIHEIKPIDNAKMYRLYDALKTLLSEDTMNIDVKYGSDGIDRVYARIMMMSNHVNCVPIEQDDERVYVMDSFAQKRSPDYYDNLYAAINDPTFMDNVFSYLKDWHYNPQDMKHLIKTPARQRLLDNTQSATARAFFSAQRCIEGAPFTPDMLESYMATFMNMLGDGMVSHTNSGELNHLKTAHLSQPVVVTLDDGTKTSVRRFGSSIPDITDIDSQLKATQRKLVP